MRYTKTLQLLFVMLRHRRYVNVIEEFATYKLAQFEDLWMHYYLHTIHFVFLLYDEIDWNEHPVYNRLLSYQAAALQRTDLLTR